MAQAAGSNPLTAELERRGREIAASTPQHGIVRQLADGSLPEQVFLRYLVQNALFLTGYAAALRETPGAGVPPSVTELLAGLGTSISGPALDRHVAEYRSRAGRDPDLQAAVPSPITTAYTDHLRRSATSGSGAVLAAILPGEQSYAAAGRYYAAAGDLTPANPYAGWIAQYTAGQVDELVAGILAGLAVTDPGGHGQQELRGVYARSAQLDEQFWGMASGPARHWPSHLDRPRRDGLV